MHRQRPPKVDETGRGSEEGGGGGDQTCACLVAPKFAYEGARDRAVQEADRCLQIRLEIFIQSSRDHLSFLIRERQTKTLLDNNCELFELRVQLIDRYCREN